MNILIIGCGQTATRLCRQLGQLRYNISVVDPDKERLKKLDDSFDGLTICGSPVEIETLQNALAQSADVALVLTDNDNINLYCAQILMHEFSVPEVFVRVLDPTREKVFSQLGIKTFCPTRFESDYLLSKSTRSDEKVETLTIENTCLKFQIKKAERVLFGWDLNKIPSKKTGLIFGVVKKNGSVILKGQNDTKIESGDKIITASIWEEEE